MASVVLYYDNVKLKQEIIELKKEIKLARQKAQEIPKPQKQKTTKDAKLDMEIFSTLQECEEKLKKQELIKMVPIVPQNKNIKSYIYDDNKKLDFSKPYKQENNETKKQKFLLTPDFGYDKNTKDVQVRVEIKKEF